MHFEIPYTPADDAPKEPVLLRPRPYSHVVQRCAEGSGCGRRRRLPRVEARFGALVRWSPPGIDEGAYAPEGASTPADRRRGLTMGSEYVRQARRLSRKGLIKYGETVGVDVAEMESGPTAALLATSLQLPNLAAAVNVAKEKEEQAPTTVLVQLRHPELGGELSLIHI